MNTQACVCGCGGMLPAGAYKGRPRRFLHGHNRRSPDRQTLYVQSGQTYEHVQVAERALGRPMPAAAEVHHVSGQKRDNRPGNLVVCQDRAYHRLLELRSRALDACSQANWHRCTYCRSWDAPENITHAASGVTYHASCVNDYNRRRRQARKATHPEGFRAE